MSVFIGSNEITDAYVGSNQVQEIYVGSDLVWSNVPNINFDTNGWTSGEAGAIWALTEEVTAAAGFLTNPSFETTLMRIRHQVNNVGYFNTVYQDATCTVPDFNSTGSYRLHYNLATVVNSPRGTSRLDISITGGAVTNTSVNVDSPSSGTGTWDFTVNATSGGCSIRFRNQFADITGTQNGDGGRLDINGVYLEKL